MNTLIKKTFPHLNFFVDPIANDGCQAYGCSKYYYYNLSGSIKKDKLNTLYTGPEYDLEYSKQLVEKQISFYNNIENKKAYEKSNIY